jgi:hypothetical protein
MGGYDTLKISIQKVEFKEEFVAQAESINIRYNEDVWTCNRDSSGMNGAWPSDFFIPLANVPFSNMIRLIVTIRDEDGKRIGKKNLELYVRSSFSLSSRTLHTKCGNVTFNITLDRSPQANLENEKPPADDGTISFNEVAKSLLREGCHSSMIEDLKEVKRRKFDILFLLDDSGSMTTPTNLGTRWQELQRYVNQVVRIACALDDDGIDIYFLFRAGLTNVKNAEMVDSLFRKSPDGDSTPLARRFSEVVTCKKKRGHPLLVIIATDGVPDEPERFRQLLVDMPSDVYASILACTDQTTAVEYLGEIDKNVKRVDVLDDHESEKAEVLKVQGASAEYSRGTHCGRMIVGPIFPKYDNLDEWKLD